MKNWEEYLFRKKNGSLYIYKKALIGGYCDSKAKIQYSGIVENPRPIEYVDRVVRNTKNKDIKIL